MNPKIINLDQILLAGVSFFGDPFETNNVWTAENQIGRLWERFIQCEEQQANLFQGNAGYEVHIRGEEAEETGFYEVFVGMRVQEVEKVPLDLLIKVLPKATYAVITLSGTDIMSDWNDEFNRWLQTNAYKVAYPFMFEYYDERFKGMDRIEESEVDFYVPVEKEA